MEIETKDLTRAATQDDKRHKNVTEEIMCEIKSMTTEEDQKYREKRW
jgi:hypothetical protein